MTLRTRPLGGSRRHTARIIIASIVILAGILSIIGGGSLVQKVKDKKEEKVQPVPAVAATRSQSKLIRNAQKYIPARVEAYIMENLVAMGWDVGTRGSEPEGCKIWTAANATTQANYDDLHAYYKDLQGHTKAIEEFNGSVPDVMDSIRETGGDTSICKTLRPHPDGIAALFPSKQLSLTKSGYVEPLLTPMRHPAFCVESPGRNLMRIDYLVHDFEAMCSTLKPTSRRILIDMGASLSFHGGGDKPIVSLLEVYEKFGFHFDHIYAYELKQTAATDVYNKLLPEKYFTSYHWINAGAYFNLFCDCNLTLLC